MITVRIRKQFRGVPADTAQLKRLVRTVCTRFGVQAVAVSIGIVDDVEMARFNQRFLGHEGTTDCLSFDLSDHACPEEPRVFDLIVNGELAVREAVARGHAAEAELALYITHGMLHHLGFDDATAREARRMHRMEDEILQDLGYGSVYNSDTRTP